MNTTVKKELIDFDQFLAIEKQLEIRIGTIKSVELVPKNKRMLTLRVSFGDGDTRLVVTNIGDKLANIEDLEYKQLPFIMNLKPVNISGFISEAMIMVGETEDGKIEIDKFTDGVKIL